MKIRILSDLHIDINGKYPLELEDKDVFTVIAGDTSSHPDLTSKWIDNNIHNGLFIAGNHIVYNHDIKSLEQLKQMLADKYPIDNSVTFLDISTGTFYKEVNGIIFIGTTLYTDYKALAPKIKVKQSMSIGNRGLNDFKIGKTLNKNGKLDILTPEHYKKLFYESMKVITKVVEENPNKDIVIITHHCPSLKCISNRYSTSVMNASYVSKLDKFIEEHKNIKCWICGHVHHRDNFNIGDCKVILNPRGYETHSECDDWTPNCYLDTDTWTLEKVGYHNEQWEKQREEDRKIFEEWYNKYGRMFI